MRINKLRKVLRNQGIDGIVWPAHLRPTAVKAEQVMQRRGPGGRPPEVSDRQCDTRRAHGASSHNMDNAAVWWGDSDATWFETPLPHRCLEITDRKSPADRIRVVSECTDQVAEWCKPCTVQLVVLHHLRHSIPSHHQLLCNLLMLVESMQGILFKPTQIFRKTPA